MEERASEAICLLFGLTLWKWGGGASGGRWVICLCLSIGQERAHTQTRTHIHTNTLSSSQIFLFYFCCLSSTHLHKPARTQSHTGTLRQRHIRGQSSPSVITLDWSQTITQCDLSANYPEKKGRNSKEKERDILRTCLWRGTVAQLRITLLLSCITWLWNSEALQRSYPLRFSPKQVQNNPKGLAFHLFFVSVFTCSHN